MNAPLSLFLTRFSPASSLRVVEPDVARKTTFVLTDEELDARLEAVAAETRLETDLRWKAEIETLTATHAATLDETLSNARAEWIAAEVEKLSSGVERAMGELRAMLVDRLAAVLRPFVADAVVTRTRLELSDALDRLIADPTQPTLSVHGPQDLIEALQETRPSADIAWMVTDACEVAILADATRIETSLRAALADLATTES